MPISKPKLVAVSDRWSPLFAGRSGPVRIEPGNWNYVDNIVRHLNHLRDFQFEDGDVTLITVPKSGTTWVQEIVWTMRNDANLDNPLASTPLSFRSPCLEYDSLVDHLEASNSLKGTFKTQYPEFDDSCSHFIQLGKTISRPRTLKTHLPFPLLSPTLLDKGKVVYVIRDPRDVCISYYHHCKLFSYHDFQGTFDEFVDAFIYGKAVLFGPYWSHVQEAWSRRHHPNLFITFYEKLQRKQKPEMVRLNEFLGTRATDQQIENIMHYTRFGEMKKRNNHIVTSGNASNFSLVDSKEKEGGFFRQGKAGGWKTVLSPGQKDKFETWIKENCPSQEIMDTILNN